MRKAKELSALEVGRITKRGRHAVGGVAGLYLDRNGDNGSSWVLRVTVAGKRELMGLGSYPEVKLASAREKARDAKRLFDQGINPKAEKKRVASELKAREAKLVTFETAALAYVKSIGPSLSNAKHHAQWASTLKTYAFPYIGDLMVKDVDQVGVMRVLEPIWTTKNETASRVRARIETILDWAKVRGYRDGDNPAAWKGHLDKLLAAPNKVKKVKHHKAVDVGDMADFMARLRQRNGISAKALEFAILCAGRNGEIRGATWSEIDFEKRIWTIPGDRMKAKKEHLVPLSGAAITLLRNIPQRAQADFIFPGQGGMQLSDASMGKVLKSMGVDAVPHGFRSTFRDWAGDETEFSEEVAERALAHSVGSKTQKAYRRKTALEKRHALMEEWAKFCDGPVKSVPSANESNPVATAFGRWK